MAGPVSRATMLLLICGLLALGCHDEEAGGEGSFENVAWTLASGDPTARFADGTVSGWTGCNRFTASYSGDGGSLEIGAVATTQMACEPAAEAVQRDYLAALERVAAARVEGDELVLSDGDGSELLRFRAASPVGAWVATMFLQRDAVASPLAGTEVTATFGADGTLTGSAGCNTYRATYTASNGTIDVSEPVATRKACAEPAGVMEQEQAYLSALPTAANYTVEGSTLSLLTAQGTYVAVYQDR
jgi:heat shock protein HslJ